MQQNSITTATGSPLPLKRKMTAYGGFALLASFVHKLTILKASDMLAGNVWPYLGQLIPWNSIKGDWLPLV